MNRRTLLKAAAAAGTLAATGRLSAPALAQGAAARALRFVPQANLANFDPIWGTQYVVRNASAMVWDTLYGVDEELQPQRQMVEAEEVKSQLRAEYRREPWGVCRSQDRDRERRGRAGRVPEIAALLSHVASLFIFPPPAEEEISSIEAIRDTPEQGP